MKVWISQFYLDAAASFSFTHVMQLFVSAELSSVADDCSDFQRKHGPDFELMVRINADAMLSENKIMGPTVFKKTKDVEYVVTLPFGVVTKAPDGRRAAMEFLMAGIRSVFLKVGINPTKLDERAAFIIDHVCSDPTMLKGPWPYGPRSRGDLH